MTCIYIIFCPTNQQCFRKVSYLWFKHLGSDIPKPFCLWCSELGHWMCPSLASQNAEKTAVTHQSWWYASNLYRLHFFRKKKGPIDYFSASTQTKPNCPFLPGTTHVVIESLRVSNWSICLEVSNWNMCLELTWPFMQNVASSPVTKFRRKFSFLFALLC